MSVSAYNAIGALEEFLFGGSAPTPSQISNSYRGRSVQPQSAYCWEFKIIGAESNYGLNAQLYDQGSLAYAQDARLYAQEVSIPAMEQEPVVKEYRGKKFNYQGKNTSSLELNVTFYDTEDLAMYKTIYKWFRSMNEYQKNNSIEPKAGFFSSLIGGEGYMKACEITLLDTTERTQTAKYTFSDVFPVSLGEVSLDYSSSEVMTFDVSFSYFDVDVEFGSGGLF